MASAHGIVHWARSSDKVQWWQPRRRSDRRPSVTGDVDPRRPSLTQGQVIPRGSGLLRDRLRSAQPTDTDALQRFSL